MVTDRELFGFVTDTYEVFLRELFDYLDENAELKSVSQERLHIQLKRVLPEQLVQEWRYHSGYGH